MKQKVRRKGTELMHRTLSKGGLNHTESQEYKNRKDRSNIKLELTEVCLDSESTEFEDETD